MCVSLGKGKIIYGARCISATQEYHSCLFPPLHTQYDEPFDFWHSPSLPPRVFCTCRNPKLINLGFGQFNNKKSPPLPVLFHFNKIFVCALIFICKKLILLVLLFKITSIQT